MSRRGVVCRAVILASATVAAVMTTAHRTRAQVVAESVEWTNLVNATAAESSIRKSAGCGGCADAGGTSRQAITSGDGYGEFTPVLGARLFAGLGSSATTNTDPALIDFAFSFWADGGWDIRERNVYRKEGRFADGDVFRVAVVAGVVQYYHNAVLVHSSAVLPTYPLVLDTSLIESGASLASAVLTASATGTTDPVTVLTTTLSNGAVSQPYSATLQASGGSGSYVWALAGGALPDGLTLAGTGTISGTPTTAGTSAFTVRATDGANTSLFDDQPLSIHVPAPAGAVTVTTTSLPSTRVDEPYSTTLAASGGSGTFTWSVVSGALPQGLTLGSTNGTISGTAAASGRFSVTVRASDAADAVNSDDQALTVAVLAAVPPSTYDAITDRTARTKGPVPALGGAGYAFTDDLFGARMWRLTDGSTRPGVPGRSYRTPSGSHTNAWSADARFFYVTSTDGTLIPFAFDRSTAAARRLNPSATGDGGVTLRFFNEPTFSYVTPGVLYGTYNGAGANLRSVDQHDLETGVYSQLLNLDSLAPNLAGTYTGGLGSSAGTAEKIFAFFGGTSQDRHFYLVVFEKENPSNRLLLDTLASTVDGVPTNTTLNFKIHAAAIDRTGRYVTVYPTSTDMEAPRSAAPAYVWDTIANTFTATPLVESRSGGHDAYGYGYRVNQDCCTTTTWDAAQWQFRSLATPLTTADLITPVLQPKEVYLADHPSWHNAQPVAMVPFIDATYRYGANTAEWRAWDEEIIAVQTEGAGSGSVVWRFAHHRSAVAKDGDASRIYFWYTPRANVSPDGRWALFTSNWDKTLGTDPGGEVGGTFRQDTFLIELKSTAAAEPAPAPTPVSVTTTALPSGTAGQPYSAALQASGGSGTYTWSVVSGALPAGLALNASSGAISGTPTASGTVTFTARATDATDATRFDDQVLELRVASAPAAPVSITTTALPEGKRGVFYTATISSSGGVAPLSWSVAAGTLPPGLALDASSGTISGTPRDNGNWTFTIRVVDSASPATSAAQALSIKVRKAPSAPSNLRIVSGS